MTKGDVEAFQEYIDVSRETLERLYSYAQLLEKWTRKINLVAPSTLKEIWSRHFLDSAQLLELVPQPQHWVDLGSGGGFPGAVIAILLADRAGTEVTLVESDQRKASFLRTVNRELGLSFKVIAKRIEDVPPLQADVLSARALAPLAQLLVYAERHLCSDGRALFPKGASGQSEITQALECWRFDCRTYPSITDARSTILSVGEVSRV
ncbi:MAG: 16S rRNA (guanine(527)-N(7))-methyltransferase RsmG [Paracoccaceae bacterium]